MSVLIANYRGTGFPSSGVKFFTDSPYSHSAFYFDSLIVVTDRFGVRHSVYGGSVIEAWAGGVHLASASQYHKGGITVDLFRLKQPLSREAEYELARFAVNNIGKNYDYWNVARFVPLVRAVIHDPKPYSYDRTHVFCAELVLEGFASVGMPLFERRPYWKFPPGMVPTSPLLEPAGSFKTCK